MKVDSFIKKVVGGNKSNNNNNNNQKMNPIKESNEKNKDWMQKIKDKYK